MPDLPNYRFIQEIRRLPFVEGVFLFGSRARGDAAPRSDIDLAVLCPRATPQQWGEVIDITENSDTLLKIDCVRLDALEDAALRAAIEADAIPLPPEP